MSKMNPELAGALHGGTTELRFFQAFQTPDWRPPCWFRSVRRATPEEDACGVDAYVTIDAGIIPVQIKSSRTGLEKDVRHYGYQHCIVVIPEWMSQEEFRSRAVDKFYRWRGTMLGAFEKRRRRPRR